RAGGWGAAAFGRPLATLSETAGAAPGSPAGLNPQGPAIDRRTSISTAVPRKGAAGGRLELLGQAHRSLPGAVPGGSKRNPAGQALRGRPADGIGDDQWTDRENKHWLPPCIRRS